MPKKPILCIDFDGVIHQYRQAWEGEEIIPDGIVPGFFKWAYVAQEFFELTVYSSRSKTQGGRFAMQVWMRRRYEEWVDETQPIIIPLIAFSYAHEKPSAFLHIDDRALTFTGNWADFPPEKLLEFKPWNKQHANVTP